MHAEGRTRREHAARRIAPDRLREVVAGKFQQLTSATANIQPSLGPRRHTSALQESVDQKPFSPMEMERITREPIPDRIVNQLSIRVRILIEFWTFFLASPHDLHSFAP
jgi:hypothetical protein